MDMRHCIHGTRATGLIPACVPGLWRYLVAIKCISCNAMEKELADVVPPHQDDCRSITEGKDLFEMRQRLDFGTSRDRFADAQIVCSKRMGAGEWLECEGCYNSTIDYF